MAAKPKADTGKTKRMAPVVKGAVRQPKDHPGDGAAEDPAPARRKEATCGCGCG